MVRKHILVVDDEEDIRDLIRYNLEKEGYRVTGVGTGEEVLPAVQTEPIDLVLLDLMLPELDGFEVCKLLKSNPDTSSIPVVMLTAKGEETDIVAGLELGADDYITKPFSPRVLVARIRTVLRRKRRGDKTDDRSIEYSDLVIRPSRFEVFSGSGRIDLTATEFHLLFFLARHPGWVFTRSQIIDSVKGTDYPVTDRSVDVQVVGLRKKLGSAGKHIETVRGIGYRFAE